MTNEKRLLTQPPDWWEAWKAAADKEGKTLSAWVGEKCNAALSKSEAKKLTDRPPAHRPKKTDNAE